MPPRRGFYSPRIVLADADGRVVADSSEGAENYPLPSKMSAEGVPVPADPSISNSAVVGYVFAGSMIEPVLSPQDRAFLRSINRSVLLTTILVVLLAAGLGAFLVVHITAPLKDLHAVSRKIGRGDLTARVDVDRSDEIGQLAAQFNRMARSLDDASQSRKRMISDTAHELRTPVSLIQGKLEMILEGVYPGDEHTIASIYEETQLLSTLIEELQQLADADAGTLFIERAKVDVNRLLVRTAAMFIPEFEKKKVMFSVENQQRELKAYIDGRRTAQVVSNLLSNSLRHVPDGGVVLLKSELSENGAGGESALGEDGGEDLLRVSVSNSGPPIPEDRLTSVFKRFYRLDEDRGRERGGRGLGLSICKAIVEAQGGRIWAENIGAEGVRFVFILPVSSAVKMSCRDKRQGLC